ncbi:MAG TPA: FHA domain-containing protein, partial [Burkholderiaceae bacterium]
MPADPDRAVISLDVIAYNGSALPQPLHASFDETGGTIGRADNNQLVLPDPERTVSRVHAQVVFRNGGYAVVDRGSNPISVNGRPLGNGQEAPLRGGEELQIGGYVVRVGVSAAPARAAAAAADPFADFGFAAPAPAAPAARAPAAALDPLAAFGVAAPPPPARAAAAALDPLAAFGVGAAPAPAAAPGAAPAGGIPDDWNPFAPEAAAHAPPARPAGGSNLGLDLGVAAPPPLVGGLPASAPAESSLDALFGLGAPSGGDPLANSLLDAPTAQPNMAAHADPLRSLGSATRASAASQADDLSDLNRPFIAAPVQPAAPRPVPPERAPAGQGAVLSWDDTSGSNRTVIRPRAAAAAPAPAPAVAPAPPVAPAIPPMAPVAAPVVAAPAASA